MTPVINLAPRAGVGPQPVQERWVDQQTIAEHFGVSPKTIWRWSRAGMPSEDWGMPRLVRYRITDCETWARARGNVGDSARTKRASRT